jgi:5-methylthioadenosine/S-adenosylhomocysteine deaminase
LNLTVLDADLDGDRIGLRSVEGRIAAIGPGVTAEAGDEVIEAGGMPLVPPLVNGHTHAAMTLFRGFGDDLPLMEWLRTRIWPAEERLRPDDVYWGTRLAAVEMIRSGTTRFFDMYWFGAEVARAVRDSGIRASASAVLIDGLDPARGRELRPAALASVEEIGAHAPMVTPSFGPHAIYTVSRESLAWIAEVAAERELAVQIHLSETEPEVHDCVEAHGVRPAVYLDQLGLLGARTVLAHGVWLDDAELELIAERGATVVTNPAANMKLAVGAAFPYPRASERGVELGLGTDGPSSNSNLDMLEEVKTLALLQKHSAHDPSLLAAAEALKLARGRRSELLGGTPLAEGEPADFLLLRAGDPELCAGDRDADLVYAANGGIVDTTVVAGRVLMRDRVLPGLEEIVAEVHQRSKRLTGL